MHSSRGFTLTELMITVVIVGILAAVAYPSYDKFVTKGRRSDAQQLLTEIASKEAQYLFDARSYTATLGSGGLNMARSKWTCTTNCTNQYYTVTLSTSPGTVPPVAEGGDTRSSSSGCSRRLFLNSRMPLPIEAPISGMRRAPKNSTNTSSRIRISVNPMLLKFIDASH